MKTASTAVAIPFWNGGIHFPNHQGNYLPADCSGIIRFSEARN